MKQNNKVHETSLFQDNPRFKLFKGCIHTPIYRGLFMDLKRVETEKRKRKVKREKPEHKKQQKRNGRNSIVFQPNIMFK